MKGWVLLAVGFLVAWSAVLGVEALPGEDSRRASGQEIPVLLSAWSESFDGFPVGPLSPPWRDSSPAPAYAEITNTVYRGASGNSLHLSDPDVLVGAAAARSLGTENGVDVSVWLRATTTSAYATLILDSDTAWIARAGFGPSGFFISRVCAGVTTTAMAYSPNTWYQIRLVGDVGTGTYDFYVNGALLGAGLAMCYPATSLPTVTLGSGGGTSGDSYWDDVSVVSWKGTAAAGPDQVVAEGDPVLLSATVTPTSIWLPLWSDPLDPYPLGGLSAPWNDASSPPAVAEVSDVVFRGGAGRSIRLNDPSAVAAASASRSIPPSSLVNATAWVYATTTTALSMLVIESDSTPMAARAGLGPSGYFTWQVCGGPIDSPRPYLSGTWYRIGIVADSATDQYDFYVDGELAATERALCAPSNSFTAVGVASGPATIGESYWDDVDVRELEAVSTAEIRWDLDDSMDGDGDSNFTNDPDVLGASVTAAFGDDGDYRVTLTVTDSNGTQMSDSLNVQVVNLEPQVSLALASPVSITTGVDLDFTVDDAGSDDLTATWAWSDGPPGTWTVLNGAGPDPPHSPGGTSPFTAVNTSHRDFPAPGLYGVSGNATDDDGGRTAFTATVDVRDVPLTSLSIGTPTYSGAALYINGTTSLTLVAVDRSGTGIAATYYRVDGGPPSSYTSPINLATPGMRNLTYWSTDNLGGVEAASTTGLYVDLYPPTTRLSVSPPVAVVGPTTWVAPSTVFSLQSQDNGSGVADTYYRVYAGGGWSSWRDTPLNFTASGPDGLLEVEYYGLDHLAQEEARSVASFQLDGTPPASSLTRGAPTFGEWVGPTSALSLTAVDSGVGIQGISYRTWHNGTWSPWLPSAGGLSLAPEGLHFLEFAAVDLLGNGEVVRNETLRVDGTPPRTILTVGSPSVGSWITNETPLSLAAVDSLGVGVDRTEFRVWHGTWTAWADRTGPLLLSSGEGTYFVEYRSFDLLGNAEDGSNETLRVDLTAPAITYSVAHSEVGYAFTVTATASDAGSGVARLEYRLGSGPWQPYRGEFTVTGKTPTKVTFRSADALANEGTLGPETISPEYVNWKPLLSLVLVVVLLLVGLALRRKETDRRLYFAVLGGFMALEGAIGIACWLWDVLLFPPWLGLGLLVNVGVVGAGIVILVLLRYAAKPAIAPVPPAVGSVPAPTPAPEAAPIPAPSAPSPLEPAPPG